MGHTRLGACALYALIYVGLVSPSAASAQRPSFGPLTSEEGSPLQRISYTAMMEDADVVQPGALSIEVWNGFSNIFEQDSSSTHVLFLDLARLISTVTLRWGASETLEFGGRVTLETTGAGVLDGVIVDWHDRFGFGNANRDRFPEGGYQQRLTDAQGTTYLDVGRRRLGLDDIRAFAKWRALRSSDARSILSLRAEARVPLHADLSGDERTDFGLAVLGRLGVGGWYTHLMLGGATIRASQAAASILDSSSRFLTLALERSLGSSVAGVVQFQAQSAVLRSFEHRELDRAPTNLLFGLAGRFGDSWSWDASFQEDIPSDTPAVDFTVGLRVGRTW
jgi:hypothetical protein